MTFQDCICFQLGALSRKISRYYRDRIAEFNLTHSQFFLIAQVIESEGATPSQLAEETFSDRPTITGLIDRLVRDGWLERRPNPKDRRVLRIYLSDKGIKHRATFISLFNEINGSFIRRFTPNEWQQLQKLLLKLE
ncbi:MAG: MarR family transcriptional regulator [Thermodesulfobacteriota bacterium]|nr:MarR family transcriptional regulator [Thermodesulfobacteriota bacterium]